MPHLPHDVVDVFSLIDFEASERMPEIMPATGFHSVSVLWWILRWQHPILPRVRVSNKRRESGYSITLEINGNLPTWRECWELFQYLHKDIGKQMRTTGKMQRRIVQLVDSRGGVPNVHGRKGKFWEEIRQKLSKEFGENAPGTW